MAENLAPAICGLASNALQLGGNGILAIGVLYSVRGVSSLMADIIEKLPKYFDQPQLIVEDVADAADGAKNKTWMDTITDNGLRMGMVIGTIAVGVAVKAIGRRIGSVEVVDMIVSYTGGQK